MSFDSLGLNAQLLCAIREQGYHQPTRIQTQDISREVITGLSQISESSHDAFRKRDHGDQHRILIAGAHRGQATRNVKLGVTVTRQAEIKPPDTGN